MKVGVLGGGRMGAGIAHAFLLAGGEVTVVERDERGCGCRSTAHPRERQAVRRTRNDSTRRGRAGRGIDRRARDGRLRGLRAGHRGRARGPHPQVGRSPAGRAGGPGCGDRHEHLVDLGRRPGIRARPTVPVSRSAFLQPGAGVDARGDRRGRRDRARHRRPRSRLGRNSSARRRSSCATPQVSRRVAWGSHSHWRRSGCWNPKSPQRRTSIGPWNSGTGIRSVHCARPTSSGSMCASASPRSCRRALGERFAPPELLRRMVAEGRLGRKSGEGFYTLEQPGQERP